MPRARVTVARLERFYKHREDSRARIRVYVHANFRALLRTRGNLPDYLRETAVAWASAGGRHCVSICTDFSDGASSKFDSKPLTYGFTSA